jgi:hypothetical protein
MFGVRIWFTLINNTSSPAPSFRFVKFSPTLFGTKALLCVIRVFGHPSTRRTSLDCS